MMIHLPRAIHLSLLRCLSGFPWQGMGTLGQLRFVSALGGHLDTLTDRLNDGQRAGRHDFTISDQWALGTEC